MIRHPLVSVVFLAVAFSCFGDTRSDVADLLAKRTSGREMTGPEYKQFTESVSDFTDSQLVSVLHTGKDDLLRDMCRTEIMTRAALRPHWTVVPAFWLIVLAVIISIAALFLGWRAEMRAPPKP